MYLGVRLYGTVRSSTSIKFQIHDGSFTITECQTTGSWTNRYALWDNVTRQIYHVSPVSISITEWPCIKPTPIKASFLWPR